MEITSITTLAGEKRAIPEILHATFIRAEPSDVYKALTTAGGLDAWFTHGAVVDARPGGRILFRWENWGPGRVTAEDGGPVVEATPPYRFVFQWHPDSQEYLTTVEIDIRPTENGTIVCLHEHGFVDTFSGLAALANCAAGWGEALTLLKFYLEYGLHY
ncbi:MAG: SRPBCC family protein [Acidobacteriaceae bacterium]